MKLKLLPQRPDVVDLMGQPEAGEIVLDGAALQVGVPEPRRVSNEGLILAIEGNAGVIAALLPGEAEVNRQLRAGADLPGEAGRDVDVLVRDVIAERLPVLICRIDAVQQ